MSEAVTLVQELVCHLKSAISLPATGFGGTPEYQLSMLSVQTQSKCKLGVFPLCALLRLVGFSLLQ